MAFDSTISKLAELKNKITTDSPARKRLSYLFDEGVFTELDAFAKEGSSMCSVITAFGYVEGSP